jgi:iron complex outermembrane receptor protein
MVSNSSQVRLWCRRHQSIRPLLKTGAAILGIVSLWGADVAAQTAAAPSDQLEEITVTARKREENLQATPIAVTAFSAAGLEERQVNNIADVGKFVPNVSFQSGAAISGSSTSVTVFIRGIGQTDFTETIDPGVGVYVDGVYVSRTTGALLNTEDVGSIEVLRGPQGTLFGKNTIGGAVVVTSKQPTDKFEGWADVTTGSYSRLDASAMINLPINEKLKIRATGSYLSRDGYVKILQTGNSMGSQDQISGRIVALLDVNDDLSITASIDGNRNHEADIGTTLIATNENDPNTFAAFYNGVLSGVADHCAVPTSNPSCFSSNYITHDPYTTYNGSRNKSTLQLLGGSLTVNWTLPEDINLKSITAYRRLGGTFDLDSANVTFPIDNTEDDYSQRQFSQEIQLSGKAFDDKLKWIVGGYFLKELGVDRNNLVFSIAKFLSGGYVDNDSYASYVQTIYSVTDDIHLTLGGRYTFEDKRFTPDQYIKSDNTGGGLFLLSRCFVAAVPTLPPNPGCVADPLLNPNGNRILPSQTRTAMANEFTPAITLDYQITPETLAYVSFSKGFKSGGFTQRIFPPEPSATPFTPEYVDSYEFGFKNEFFDKKVRLNAAAFFTDYTALQIIVNDPGNIAPKVRNAGKANINGGELEAEWIVSDWLRLNGGLGYTDANYREVGAFAQNAGVTLGSKLPYTPKWTGTLGVSADVWRTELGLLSLRADTAFKSAYFPAAVNAPITKENGYATLNLSATFVTDDNQWQVTVGGTNVTSTKYQITSYQDLAAAGVAYAAYARPAEWFLKAKYSFGGTADAAPEPVAYTPPPVAAPATMPKSYLVFFDFNKSDLTPQAATIVDTAAKNAVTGKVTKLDVTGHTDTVGSDAYNMRLSRRRAESVAAELEKQGVPSSEIAIYAKGKRDLLVPTADGVKEPQNRRVQIVYSDGAAS